MSEETLEKNSTHKPIKGHGGARDGAGRKSGKMSEENRAKLEVLEKMRKRIMRSSEKLLNSQMNLAEGISYLYVIKTNSKGLKEKAELITNQLIIEKFLAGELEGLKDEYYYITTERPDNRALDSLWDRTFGKVPNLVEGTGESGEIIIKQIIYAEGNNSAI